MSAYCVVSTLYTLYFSISLSYVYCMHNLYLNLFHLQYPIRLPKFPNKLSTIHIYWSALSLNKEMDKLFWGKCMSRAICRSSPNAQKGYLMSHCCCCTLYMYISAYIHNVYHTYSKPKCWWYKVRLGEKKIQNHKTTRHCNKAKLFIYSFIWALVSWHYL